MVPIIGAMYSMLGVPWTNEFRNFHKYPSGPNAPTNIVWETPAAINNPIPEPIPYFETISSK